MRCSDCGHWTAECRTVYDDGAEIVTYAAPVGKGRCGVLNLSTDPDFGCMRFSPGNHVIIEKKSGSPWQHSILISCPDCEGRGSHLSSQRHCERCVGIGKVQRYDDGHIGENKTRRHPRESSDQGPVDAGTKLQSARKSDGGIA